MAGADALVIGRPITNALNVVETIGAIHQEIANALKVRQELSL